MKLSDVIIALMVIATVLFTTSTIVILVKQRPHEARCDAGYVATKYQCATEYENKWFDSGADVYSRGEHLKDIPLCDRIAEIGQKACKGELDESYFRSSDDDGVYTGLGARSKH